MLTYIRYFTSLIPCLFCLQTTSALCSHCHNSLWAHMLVVAYFVIFNSKAIYFLPIVDLLAFVVEGKSEMLPLFLLSKYAEMFCRPWVVFDVCYLFSVFPFLSVQFPSSTNGSSSRLILPLALKGNFRACVCCGLFNARDLLGARAIRTNPHLGRCNQIGNYVNRVTMHVASYLLEFNFVLPIRRSGFLLNIPGNVSNAKVIPTYIISDLVY